MPMSARDVQPILERLNGRGFQIGPGSNIKDFGSFTGPSSSIDKVHLYNELTYNIKEMSSVEVSIPGIFTEGEIIIGAHRDSLASSSAGDANSGKDENVTVFGKIIITLVRIEGCRGFPVLEGD